MFSNTKIGSVTSFSILFNFQGPVRLRSFDRRLDYFITEVIFCQALFSEAFRFCRTSGSIFIVSRLVLPLCFPSHSEVILSCLAWCSSIIPHPAPFGKPFFAFFASFFTFVTFYQFFIANPQPFSQVLFRLLFCFYKVII